MIRKIVAIAAVAMMAMAGQAVAAMPGGCPGGEGARSTNSNTSVNLTFRNSTDQKLTAFWLNFEGQRVRYADISPGRSWSVDTFAGHPWAFVTEHGACVDLYYTNKGDRRHTIH